MNQLDVGPKVLGIEQVRPAHYLMKGERATGKPYRRTVDIVLEAPDNNEEWVEIKSLSKSTFSKSKFKNDPFDKDSYFREFFQDLRLNDDFITTVEDNYDKIIPEDEGWKGNKHYSWWFQLWRDATKGIPPKKAEESKAQEWLCYKPNIGHIKNYYNDNMALTPNATISACRATSGQRIKLRDTESYVSEVIARLIRDKDLDAQDYLDFINGITDPEWQ